MLNDPQGIDKLLKLGTRKVPVVARGREFVFGQNLEDVAKFVGLGSTGHSRQPASDLVRQWIVVLRAAQRYVRQLPIERLDERVIPNRDRPIRLLCHHVFRIGEAFVETAAHGKEYLEFHAQQPPADGTMKTGEDIARYGEDVIVAITKWWEGVSDRSGQQEVKTYYGAQPLHELLERSTWHSAQHARQLIAVLERYGIEPNDRLSPADLAGLPLPERLFE